MRVLLVKLSSMGDVIHNLPVVADLVRAFPDIKIDWVTEAPYADVVRLHPRVERILKVNLRRLKEAWWRSAPWIQLVRDRQAMVEQGYDVILDTQGLVKSVMVARWANGLHCGFSRPSARESFASHFYDRTFDVPKGEHAVTRNRKLAAAVFGYALPEQVDYGITAPAGCPSWLTAMPYAVLLHATSRADKQWPRTHWLTLGRQLNARGLTAVLPWGGEAEKQVSELIAAQLADAVVPPAMSLTEAATLLAGADAVVGVDTGLAHLAVALGRPTIGLYVSTSPGLTGLFGSSTAVNLGGGSRSAPTIPSVEEVMRSLPPSLAQLPAG